MTIRLNVEKIAVSPEHMAIYKLCLAGVGFYNNGRYEFISHNGDYIGEAPVYRVEPFLSYMKRNFGIRRDRYPRNRYETQWPITFGFQGLVEHEIIQQWMDELFKTPIVLH